MTDLARLSSGTVRPAPFILLTKSRSGSKWLVELLDTHEQLAVYGELYGGAQVRRDYGAQGVPRFEEYIRSRSGRLPRAALRARYLHAALDSRRDVRAVGVKFVYRHATRGVHWYLAARRARVVHLIRSNLLDALLSYEVGSARGFRGARIGEQTPAASVHLDAGGLRERLVQHERSITRARSRLLLYRIPALEVFYEELVSKHEETMGGILAFLGVGAPVEPLQSTFAPIDDVPREDVVANLDEVREALAGTRFEWMLEPGVRARSAIA